MNRHQMAAFDAVITTAAVDRVNIGAWILCSSRTRRHSLNDSLSKGGVPKPLFSLIHVQGIDGSIASHIIFNEKEKKNLLPSICSVCVCMSVCMDGCVPGMKGASYVSCA